MKVRSAVTQPGLRIPETVCGTVDRGSRFAGVGILMTGTPDAPVNGNGMKTGMETDEAMAFNQAYEKYYPEIFRQAAYLTGCAQAAEDIAQEAFFRLYSSPPSHSNTEAWLRRVAGNLAYNFLRGEKRRRKMEPAVAEDDAEKVVSIEDRVLVNNDVRLVRKVLANLPPRDRMCLLLKFSGYRYDEIAEIVNIAKTSVGATLARAQAKFRKMYLKEV